MKRVLIIFFSLILLFSCGPKIYETGFDNSEINYGISQKNQYEKLFSIVQFDSICRADKISNDLNKNWHKLSLFNPHTGERLTQYLYIRNLPNEQHIYRVQVTQYKDSLKITKRIEK